MPYRSAYAVKAKPHFFAPGTSLSSLTQPDPSTGTAPFTGTKLVATTGPSCQDSSTLQAMLLKGVGAMRLDLTWGSLEFHLRTLSNLQGAMLSARRMAACIVDTTGREITIRRSCQPEGGSQWPVHGEEVDVEVGQMVVLSTEVFNDHRIIDGRIHFSVSYDKLPSMVHPQDKIWISRYLSGGSDTPSSLFLDVVAVSTTEVVCVAQNQACLTGLLTVFHAERSDYGLENMQNDLPVLSAYDKACLKEISKRYEVDFISLSYTKTTQDVLAARLFLDEIGMTSTRILAKVEVRQALFNFNGILNASDGIILSRGNLGLDCLPEKMALLQKSCVQACNLVGKPVLVTRFMDSMTHNPRPTRAEVTDAANAVLDGVDGMLLGAETVRGLYPLETVETISQIAREAEKVFDYKQHYDHLMQTALDIQQLDECLGEAGGSEDFEADSDIPLRNAFALSGAPRNVHFVADNPGSHTTETYRPGSTTHDGEDAASHDGSTADGHTGGHQHLTEANHLKTSSRSKSLGTLSQAIRAMNINSTAETVSLAKPPLPPTARGPSRSSLSGLRSPLGSTLSLGLTAVSRPPSDRTTYYTGLPFLSKMESITSSAVRVAEKVGAKLILVLTHTTSIAQLLSKYRPPMPILTLIVPNLISDGLTWKLEGRSHARQCLLIRGVLPMLAAPSPGTDELLDEAVSSAARMGLVVANDFIVCVERLCNEEFSLKVVAVDETATGVKRDQGTGNVTRMAQHTLTPKSRRQHGLSVVPPPLEWSPAAFGVASTRAIALFGPCTITPKGSNPFVGITCRPIAPWSEAQVDEEEEEGQDEGQDKENNRPQGCSGARPFIHTMSSLGHGLDFGYADRTGSRGAAYRNLSSSFVDAGKGDDGSTEGEAGEAQHAS